MTCGTCGEIRKEVIDGVLARKPAKTIKAVAKGVIHMAMGSKVTPLKGKPVKK